MHADEALVWWRLAETPGVSRQAARTLLQAIGLPEDILAASQATLAGLVGQACASALLAAPTPESEARRERMLTWIAQPDHHLIALHDPDYPRAWLDIDDPPLMVYVAGNPAALGLAGVAIVGSRNASAYGLGNARQFASALAGAGLCIVSGLALGVDAAAHEAALEAGGTTVAVLGTGVDVIYPSRHKALAQRILAQGGALVSEAPLGTPALSYQFPKRNRLISGLSHGVLVVEAALRSGSLITARVAAEQGRDVFAIPGSIHSPLSKGCHSLIRQGAKLVDDARDILDEWLQKPWAAQLHALDAPSSTGPRADDPEPPWLVKAGWDPFTLDELAQRTGASAGELSAALLDWELDGRIERLPGGRWQKCPHVHRGSSA